MGTAGAREPFTAENAEIGQGGQASQCDSEGRNPSRAQACLRSGSETRTPPPASAPSAFSAASAFGARIAAVGGRVERGLSAAALLALVALPIGEVLFRALFNRGIPGSSGYVQSLTVWVGFLGAMVAASERRHLSLSTGADFVRPRFRAGAAAIAGAISTAVAAGLCWASLQFVRSETASPLRIGAWLPVWMVEAVLPAAFAVIALRFVVQAGAWGARGVACLGIPAAAAIGFSLAPYGPQLVWPGIGALVVAGVLGAPIFVMLGGAALLLFFAEGVQVASIPVETYRIITSPSIPTIPLFTLTGAILAAGGDSRRLVRLFRALFGWMPGGLAIAATLVCAFFTTFTGASGVTILALGGLLLPVLVRNGYPPRLSIGLLTATGSIGLLFPPSLPVILYGVVGRVPIPDLFKAGIVPGLLLVAAVCLFAVRAGVRCGAARPAFDPREAAAALWESKWDIGLPVVALAGIFGGFCTLIEAAALTVAYALVLEAGIHRTLHVTRDLPRVLVTCMTLIGGVFIILGVAMGLTNYLVDAQVPMRAAAWVQAHLHSRLLFLLALNGFLLLVGCLMDIFSAIVVVVPLIVPIGRAFGIDPLHLGMIFLANLELGYLTPPVGMNLFLAAYRFETPLIQVYRDVVPFLLVLLGVVLLITYVPALTLAAPGLLSGVVK